jgi:GH25 family lysozyme M1 (1,4-beta-N-acetylmuramidase)
MLAGMRAFRLMADVSSNNGAINLAAYAAAGHAGIAIKASEGVGYVNPLHKEWCAEAHWHGLTVVHYHFARPGHLSVGRELANFHHTWLEGWRQGDMLALDLEVSEIRDTAGYARAFLQGLGSFGHPVVLYTYHAFRAEHLAGVKADRLWVADYSAPLSSEHQWAKQYTDGVNGPQPHHYAGIGQCDGSVLNWKTAATWWARKLRTGRR